MPEVQIRPAVATDLHILMAIDHSCTSEYVWQMDRVQEDGQVGAVFREIRLPRAVVVLYPRPVAKLADEWSRRTGMLVAVVEKEVVGYLRLSDKVIPQTAWITDAVVASRLRRRGIGTALVLAAQAWALERGNHQSILEMSSKNCAAVSLAEKLGYEFCGYNDHYYVTQDIALFFGRTLR
jgi:ribosomal protein S18 acetylase RimI-like enzyme